MDRIQKLALAVVTLATIGVARPAVAGNLEPGAPEKTDDRTDAGGWYGGAALLVDGISLALVAGGYRSKTSELIVLGSGTYLLGGPINYVNHGHPGRAVGSLLLRAATLSVGLAAVVEESHCTLGDGDQHTACSAWPRLAVLGVAMAVTTTAIDALAFDTPSPKKRPPLRPAVEPTVLIGQNSSVVGLAGRF